MSWLVIAWQKDEFKGLAKVYGFDTKEPAERKAREESSREDTGIVELCLASEEEAFRGGMNTEENYAATMRSLKLE